MPPWCMTSRSRERYLVFVIHRSSPALPVALGVEAIGDSMRCPPGTRQLHHPGPTGRRGRIRRIETDAVLQFHLQQCP